MKDHYNQKKNLKKENQQKRLMLALRLNLRKRKNQVKGRMLSKSEEDDMPKDKTIQAQ